MHMKQFILEKLGLQKKSRYVRDFFYAANMRSSIYMSVVIIAIELWMIIRLLIRQLSGVDPRTADYYVTHYFNYGLLLAIGLAMLVFAMRFVRGKKYSRRLGHILTWSFMFICVFFGVQISLSDYMIGEQVLTFLTMELFAACLLTWYPYIGISIISLSYGVFYYMLEQLPAFNTGLPGTTPATKINLLIMWLATVMCSLSSYNRTLSQALKDENLEQLNSHLSEISQHDEMTGIHNMVYFRSEAEKMLRYVTTDKENIIFLFFDIENFKSYNDKYGFGEGNRFLKEFAGIINDTFRDSLVSRFSDDHFVVLTHTDGAEDNIRRLSEEVRRRQGDVNLQIKCGGYKPDKDEKDPSIACDRARFACNSIKKHPHRTFRLYDKKLDDKYRLKQYIVNNIDTAIDNGYIKVFYQPIISSDSSTVTGLEALARWDDPIHGMISPAVFIVILEEYRQIYKLDQYITDKVCRDMRDALDSFTGVVPVSLNFSRLDFELCDIVGFLCDTVKKYDIDKKYIDVEITESALNDQQEFLPTAIRQLREHGFRVWLDDFGSGYSSLNVLKDYQFDVLKIDMKFLSGFTDNDKSKPILENIVDLTKQLNMVSLTEGVETAEQFEFLRSIGCDRVQGFYFSKPVPMETLREKIQNGELYM